MTAGIQPNVPRPPRSPLARSEQVSWRERFEALKNVPPLLKMVWETHRGYAAAIIALRLVRALIPLAVLWVGKLIIDGVVAAIAAHGAGTPVEWRMLIELVALELVI